MDKELAIERLNKMRRVCDCDECNINCEVCEEALNFGIEAVVLRDKYIKAVERMIEGVKEINRFLEEAAEKSDEKHQLFGETSTTSKTESVEGDAESATTTHGRLIDADALIEDIEEMVDHVATTCDMDIHAVVLNADVVKEHIDNAPTAISPVNQKQITGKLESVENATSESEESTTGQPKSKLDLISRQEVLGYIDRLTGSGLGKMKSLEYIQKYVERMEPSVAPKPVGDCISRQQAIDGLCQNCEAFDCIVNGSYCGHDCTEVAILKNLPPVNQKQVTGKLKTLDDSLLTDDSEACNEQKSKLESDNISRQAVIDYLNKLLDGRYDAEKSAMIQGIRTNIRLLPPVTPKEQQEHGRLIDADYLLQETFVVDEEEWTTPEIRAILENAPPVEPKRPKGEWVSLFDGNEWFIHCSKCKTQHYEEDLLMGGSELPDYCPNCGADMRGDK